MLILRTLVVLGVFASLTSLTAQQRPNPGLVAQKEAMRRLSFLAGKWTGQAIVQTGPGASLTLQQTEEVEYRLDGSILLIEGTGRDPGSGKVMFNAVAIVSYDESKQQYFIRAYSDGRKVDTEFQVESKGFAWGFPTGSATVRHVMQVNAKGEWEETSTVKFGDREIPSVRMLLQKVK